MKHLHISLIFSIYKQGYDSSDLEENPFLSLPKILGSFDAQKLHRLTVQKRGMLGDSETFFFKCLKLAITKIRFCHISLGFWIWTLWWKCLEPFFEVKMWLTTVSVFDVLCPAISTDWKEIVPTYRVSQKNALSDCYCTHSALAQSSVADPLCLKIIFWSFLTEIKGKVQIIKMEI